MKVVDIGRARGEGGSEGGAAMMDFHAGPSADERAINSLLSEGRPLRPLRAGKQAALASWSIAQERRDSKSGG